MRKKSNISALKRINKQKMSLIDEQHQKTIELSQKLEEKGLLKFPEPQKNEVVEALIDYEKDIRPKKDTL